MQVAWDFFQKQLLGMGWLNAIIGSLLSSLGLDLGSRIGASLQFFIYDTIKILFLLSFLIFIISYIQSHFPPEKTKKILGRFKGIGANIASALLGTLTPFCSCSSIPLFIGFTNAGLPVGVTFSFLISSPLVDLGALVLLMSVFGARIAIAYVLVGLVLAVAGGTLIDKLGMEDLVVQFKAPAGNGASCAAGCGDIELPELTRKDRLLYAREQTLATVRKVWLYVIAGVGIGALIHNWIPAEWIEAVLGGDNPFSVLLATLVGIPMYADIFGTIPIAEALYAKGVGVGTILSFMMAVTALSLPSIIMLKKVLKMKLLVTFVGIVALGIIAIGYSFNALGFIFI
ncbi:MAG: permease [Rectinemataceae bacterium]|nr:permease [Rectinemataceae bacterium]